METRPREGVMKEEKFRNTRKPSHWWICGEFWTLRGQRNWEEKNPQNTCLTSTPTREVAETLASAFSEQGLSREARIASSVLRVRTSLIALRII